jgi:hypothetical protein
LSTGDNGAIMWVPPSKGSSVPGYPAGPGWDLVTGLGTPNAALLIPDLVDAAHS